MHSRSPRSGALGRFPWLVPAVLYDEALTCFEPRMEPDPQDTQAFVTSLRSFGLRVTDGTLKAAREAWVDEAGAYFR